MLQGAENLRIHQPDPRLPRLPTATHSHSHTYMNPQSYTQPYMYACTPWINMCAYNHIHAHTLTSTHTCMHTHRVYVHTHTSTQPHTCTQNHTHSHICMHTIIGTYTVTTHTHKSHIHQARTAINTCTHTHTAPTYPGFGGPWSPLPVNPGTLGYLKVRGAYVRLITKPTGLGSGPRSRRGLSPSSLRSTHTSREKEGLQGSSQGWKWISQFPHTLRSQPRACKDVAPVSLTLVRWRVWRRLESRGRGSQGLPGVLGALEEVGFRVSAAV